MKIVLFYLLLFLAALPAQGQSKKIKTKKPQEAELITPRRLAKNVILLIGDGMGLTQISAGMYSNQNALHLEQFPVTGLQKNNASDNLIPDSAAAATAISSGVKTRVGAIGVNKELKPVRTILEEAETKGLSTGMIVSGSLTDATPSAFLAHVPSIEQKEEIAKAYLDTEIDFFVGGGKKFFDQRQNDTRNLFRELEQKGYLVSDYTKTEVPKVTLDLKKNFAFFTAEENPASQSDGRSYLLPASSLGTVFLKSHGSKGFFFVVGGSQIDWGGHANDSRFIVSEMLEFDQVIGAMLDFAREDGETLVIVTGNHETGGYAINPGSQMNALLPAFNTESPTAVMIPVFAFGPGADLFSGIYENTEIYRRMRKAMGWD